MSVADGPGRRGLSARDLRRRRAGDADRRAAPRPRDRLAAGRRRRPGARHRPAPVHGRRGGPDLADDGPRSASRFAVSESRAAPRRSRGPTRASAGPAAAARRLIDDDPPNSSAIRRCRPPTRWPRCGQHLPRPRGAAECPAALALVAPHLTRARPLADRLRHSRFRLRRLQRSAAARGAAAADRGHHPPLRAALRRLRSL